MGVKEFVESLGVTWKDTYNNIVAQIENEVDEYIKNYCNISSVPSGLANTKFNMVVGRFLNQLYSFGLLTGIEFENVVSSIKEGDTQVNFSTGSTPTSIFQSYVNGLKNADANTLIKYRKLVW